MEKQKPQLVYNFHITEKCNYQCDYCFAEWEKKDEIWRINPNYVFNIIDDISDSSKLFPEFSEKPRLNFAGGEPLILGEKLTEFAKYAFYKGIDVSIITNGSMLVEYKEILPYLAIVGISIDSMDCKTNRKIGRCCGNKTISKDELEEIVRVIREINPKIILKFNVVVNEWNCNSKIAQELLEFCPQKIKILRQTPFKNKQGITYEQFRNFVESNNFLDNPLVVVEDNQDMVNSYLMIDPSGRFFENGHGDEYLYSKPIYEVGLKNALKEIKFDVEKFLKRY
ncbi:MAG: viperin family antiviral radical SAM protein [Chitinivibrionia bacterium]|nr:viperin family antiviral radical SAM protein [Chitinivibrionia bacterium]